MLRRHLNFSFVLLLIFFAFLIYLCCFAEYSQKTFELLKFFLPATVLCTFFVMFISLKLLKKCLGFKSEAIDSILSESEKAMIDMQTKLLIEKAKKENKNP